MRALVLTGLALLAGCIIDNDPVRVESFTADTPATFTYGAQTNTVMTANDDGEAERIRRGNSRTTRPTWFSGSGDEAAPARGGATHAELEALVDHAVSALDRFGHFRGDDERARSRVHWRRTLADAALRGDDVRALHRLCETFLRGAVRE